MPAVAAQPFYVVKAADTAANALANSSALSCDSHVATRELRALEATTC